VTEAGNNQTKDFVSVMGCADKKPFNAIPEVSSNFLRKIAH